MTAVLRAAGLYLMMGLACAPSRRPVESSAVERDAGEEFDRLRQRIFEAQTVAIEWEDRHPEHETPHTNRGKLWLADGGRIRLWFETEMAEGRHGFEAASDGKSIWFWPLASKAEDVARKEVDPRLATEIRRDLLLGSMDGHVMRIIGPFVGRPEQADRGAEIDPAAQWVEPNTLEIRSTEAGERTRVRIEIGGEGGLPLRRVLSELDGAGEAGETLTETFGRFELDEALADALFEAPQLASE